MNTKKIIFVTYGGGHVNMLIPIILELQKKDNLELTVLGLTTAGAILEKNNISYLGFKDILKAGDKRALRWGRKLTASTKNNILISDKESIAYMGLSYLDLETKYGINKASILYKEKGRQAFYPVPTMERFLSNEAPDLVIATNSPRSERAAITAAGNLGIKSICLVDLYALQEVQWIGQPGYANKVCVLSDFVKETMLKSGRSSGNIVVTGNPVFDRLIKYKGTRKIWRNKKGWQDDTMVILWASQPEPENHPFEDKIGNSDLPREIEGVLIDIMNNHPNWYLIIRAHPSEVIHYDNLPKNAELSDSRESLYELLAAVDLVVTMTSTVGLEAALLGKPVVSIDLSVFTNDAPYSKMGISKGVDDLSELESVLISGLEHRWRCTAELPEIGCATNNVLSVISQYV